MVHWPHHICNKSILVSTIRRQWTNNNDIIEIIHLSKHFAVVEYSNGSVPIGINDGNGRFTKSETNHWDCQLEGCLSIWTITGPVVGFHHLIVVSSAALTIELNWIVLTQRWRIKTLWFGVDIEICLWYFFSTVCKKNHYRTSYRTNSDLIHFVFIITMFKRAELCFL